MFWLIKRLNAKKIKEEIKDIKKKPLFETVCPYGEDKIIIKSDSAVTADQMEKVIDIIEKDYYQSEKELSDIGIELSKKVFDSQKIIQVTDTNDIEIVVLSESNVM